MHILEDTAENIWHITVDDVGLLHKTMEVGPEKVIRHMKWRLH